MTPPLEVMVPDMRATVAARAVDRAVLQRMQNAPGNVQAGGRLQSLQSG
jgi:hypothetical protein